MKKANNNEVDILLQALARGRRDAPLSQSKRASEGQNPLTSNHLDADELNSYAEGVVPDPAHARYTEHLADCDRCRGIVIGLTQVAGAASRYEVLEQPSRAGFWQKLAALFSPPVLRYAVPALALTAVIAISLVALRQRQQSEFVAQDQPLTAATPSIQPAQTDSQAIESKNEGALAIREAAGSQGNSGSAKEKNNSADDQRLAKSADVPAHAEVAPVPAKAAPKSGEESRVGQTQPTFAAEPPPAPPASRSAEKTTALRREQAEEREIQDSRQEESNRQADKNEVRVRDEDQTHGPSRGAASSVGRRRIDGLSAGGPRKDKKDSGGDVETRTVSGRRFRHEGNTWVDTAYESSRSTIKVSRDSEQFRALSADEPAIRSIAEQLDGVVIVVWKGRAYRIQ